MSSLTLDRSLAAPRPAAPAEPVDSRIVAIMRCALAASALAIIYLDPTEPARYVVLTYISLGVYCAWSVVLLVLTRRRVHWTSRWGHWFDVAWATHLVALTEGTNSIFFFLFVFAMLVASFSRGYLEGLAVTVASVVLYTGAGYVSKMDPYAFRLNRALIRPVYMLALGAIMSFWGGRELALRRRLVLLRDVARDWNPRRGVDRTIGESLGKMVRFFHADSVLLVVHRGAPAPAWRAYRVARGQEGGAAAAHEIDEASGRMLTDLPGDRPVCYRRTDPAGAPEGCERLANLLDADHFMSVAYVQRDGTRGRLYLCAGERQCSQSRAEFLGQLTDTIAQLAENTDLMDQLVARAAEHERFRLSLDIHDTTVQPYIGLKLALDALRRQAGPGNPLAPRIAELLEMADATILDLRGYASGLSGKTALTSEALGEAIREQASRMERFYGVSVDVSVELPIPVGGTLAAELFHIASEGLSNVKRHTSARSAFVRLARKGPEIELSIGNEASEPVAAFVPRSISQRAAALGGRSWVETASPRSTIVHVRIPA